MSDTTPIIISELSGIALNWAVAYVEEADTWQGYYTDMVTRGNYSPSTDWAVGGRILEQERIWVKERYEKVWDASKIVPYESRWKGQLILTGQTYLEAGMRCHVANKLGDTISIPNELLDLQANK